MRAIEQILSEAARRRLEPPKAFPTHYLTFTDVKILSLK